jgi:hypothetical protein
MNGDDSTRTPEVAQLPGFCSLLRWPWPGANGLMAPVSFPSLSAMALVYSGSRAEACRLLPDARMQPVDVAPGRCLIGLVGVEYHESELGPYREFGLTIPVAFGARPLPLLSMLREGLSRTLSAWIVRLPVTTERARDGGIRLAGFPKELADVRFEAEGPFLRGTVAYDGQVALSWRIEAGDEPGERELALRSYTMIEGVPLVSRLVIRQRRFRDQIRPKPARLELGSGPLAETLRALQLGETPLAGHYCSSARALLFPPRNVLDD